MKHVRKVFEEETSESDTENVSFQESDDSRIECEEETMQIDEDLSKILVNDFVLVKFATKTAIKYFVGQVEEISENEYFINFLKMIRKYAFVFPEKKDGSHVSQEDVILKLSNPKTDDKATTVRSASIFKFNESFDGFNMGH